MNNKLAQNQSIQPTQSPQSEKIDSPSSISHFRHSKNQQNQNWLVLLLAITITAFISIAGVLLYQDFVLVKNETNITQENSQQKPTEDESQAKSFSSPTHQKNSDDTKETSNNTNLTPSPNTTRTQKTYTNKKYGFQFNYPDSWTIEKNEDSDRIVFSNISKGHSFMIVIDNVVGFGYCYKYDEPKTIQLAGKNVETADGVSKTSEACEKPEESNSGNSYVLIPLGDKNEINPTQIHISYDYPLNELNFAKNNLKEIISSFSFIDKTVDKDLSAVRAAAENYLDSDAVIQQPKIFYDNIYTVSYSFPNNPGGGSILVGKIDGKWTVAEGETHCKWIEDSNTDEATKSYMGGTDCGY